MHGRSMVMIKKPEPLGVLLSISSMCYHHLMVACFASGIASIKWKSVLEHVLIVMSSGSALEFQKELEQVKVPSF